MALFNYATKEITLKIVYYGPGLSGKTTNLQYLHSVLSPETKGKLLSLSTEADRTLFFDFLPIELGKIRDFSIRFQLYTVPGQVRYNATRKVVLKGADAVVFVADSQKVMHDQNIESFANMRENLSLNNINPDDVPVVLQYNKRDLNSISSVAELNSDLNMRDYPVIEACAVTGTGVEDTFKLITKLLIRDIAGKHKVEISPSVEKESAEAPCIETASEVQTGPAVIQSPAAAFARHEVEIPPSGGQNSAEAPRIETASEVQTGPAVIQSPAAAFARHEELIPEYEGEKTRRVQPELEQRDVVSEPGKAPVFPVEKIDLLVDEIVKIHGIILELKNSVGLINEEVKVLKKMKGEQERSAGVLRDLASLFENIKTKKTWFRF